MRKYSLIKIILFIVFILPASSYAVKLVKVGQGTLAGLSKENVTRFLGVPYAAPPVGSDRWRPPLPAPAWDGIRNADKFGASCMQREHRDGLPPWTSEYWPQNEFSEDCLFLNIWIPDNDETSPLPVFVFIHGGGFSSGSGSVPLYDGGSLSQKGIIVVTINYRVGIFGFLAHPELTQEAGSEPPANFGLQDQIAALQWVRNNISKFGGDPDQITVGGQSAGAFSIHNLLVSTKADGLFHRAIISSGVPPEGSIPELSDAESNGVAAAKSLQANSVEELRSIPATDLLTLINPQTKSPYPFIPCIDGILLPEDPYKRIRSGMVYDIPVLQGKTYDEGSALTPGWGAATLSEYQSLFSELYGKFAPEIISLYPAGNSNERINKSKIMLNDRGLMALFQWSAERAETTDSPVYLYNFVHREPDPLQKEWGAFHSSDIAYLFDNLQILKGRIFTAYDKQVASNASSALTQFIKTGQPAQHEKWPPFDVKEPAIYQFGGSNNFIPLLNDGKIKAFKMFQQSGGETAVF